MILGLHCFVDQDLVGHWKILLGRVDLVLEGDTLRHPDVALDETRRGVLTLVRVCAGEVPRDVVAVHGVADKVAGEGPLMV